MLDLGLSFLISVEREPHALAIVDGQIRLSYQDWLQRILPIVTGFKELGLKKGDHIVTVLQNRLEAATIHWACQFAGLIITPVNWRARAEELDYVIENAQASMLIYEECTMQAVAGASSASNILRICVDKDTNASHSYEALTTADPAAAIPQASAEDVSVMLYTSGTTGRGKGVPRLHRAERAAAVAHIAQNQYGKDEVTLGVMPLYHTMGVRSLIAMCLINGKFICQHRFNVDSALELIEKEKISNLYLVPTLYHDLVYSPRFPDTDISSVKKLGYAGANMTDGLLKQLDKEFKPELFVNHYGSSEIYTFTIEADAASKPGSAGKAGLNQRIRVVKLNSTDPDELTSRNEEGQIIASLESDEAFQGYWHRPEADAKSIHSGWYFTGDIGYFDEDGDLFVTGRVDDMIISGGENILPTEIESVLSLHEAVGEVAVVGLSDERLGQVVAAFLQKNSSVSEEELDRWCVQSELAAFKRPRAYYFVTEIPKSPVGKLLRRKLVDGEYELES
jgi:2-furoate---CoA ligase